MEIATTEETVSFVSPSPSILRHAVRFALHLLAVYAIVHFTAMLFAGFAHGRLLPLIQHHPPTVSAFQFAFSHLFVFSFYPAIVAGFIYAHWYHHKVAYVVWLVPLVIL